MAGGWVMGVARHDAARAGSADWPPSVVALLTEQVKVRSEELSSGYEQLEMGKAELEEQRSRLNEQQAAAEADCKAAKVAQAATEAMAQQAAEARLEAAAELRKVGQERLESLRAAEAAREMQLRLAAHVRAAVAANVPRAAELWQQLGAEMATGGIQARQGNASVPDFPLHRQEQPAADVPSKQAEPARQMQLRPGLAPLASAAAVPQLAPHNAAALPAGLTGGQPVVEGDRFRRLLADLEGSIDRWRGQLRAGEPLTFDAAAGVAGGPGGARFYAAPCAAQAAAAAALQTKAGSPCLAGVEARRQGRRAEPAQPPAQPPVEDEEAEDEDVEDEEAQTDSSAAEEEDGGKPIGRRPRSASQCAAVQTTVSYIDAPRAFVESGSIVHSRGSASVPCSPSKQRAGLPAGTEGKRPASAGMAARTRNSGGGSGGAQAEAGGSLRGSSPAGRHLAAGEVRAVRGEARGLTIPAEYSLPGSSSPYHSKPRKWLKFKSGSNAGRESEAVAAALLQPAGGSADQESSRGSGWGGIFAFRRSIDGSSGKH